MYKTIVLAYDGSDTGQKALLDGQAIGQWSQARLVLVAVIPLPMPALAAEAWTYSPEIDETERARVQAVLDAGVHRLQAAGLQARGELVTGHSVDEIVRLANQEQADLIVVGHRHRDTWAQRWWSGSVSKSLIEHASCNVLVVITR